MEKVTRYVQHFVVMQKQTDGDALQPAVVFIANADLHLVADHKRVPLQVIS